MKKDSLKNLVHHKGLKICTKCRKFFNKKDLRQHSMHGIMCDICAKKMGL